MHIDLEPQYVTVGEVATVLRLSTRTIIRQCNEGAIPHVRVGREYRIPIAWLRDLQQSA